MENEFVPENDLERALLKAKQGELPFNELLPFVMNQEIMVLSKTMEPNKDPGKQPKMGDLLVVYGQNDDPQIAALTSMNRAKEKQKTRPEYNYASVLQCGELFGNIAEGVGLVINPNMKVGLQLYSNHVKQLKVFLRKKTTEEGASKFVFDELFAPENSMEPALLKALIENLSLHEILHEIINRDIVLIGKDPEMREPLYVAGRTGDNLVACFSSIHRAKKAQDQYPDFKHSLEVKFGQLFVSLPEGVGLAINPGAGVGLVLGSDIAKKLKKNIKSD